MKDNILLILALLVIFISAGFIYLSGGVAIKEENVLAPTKETSSITAEESEEEILKTFIKQAIVDKRNVDPTELEITVNTIDGNYASGSAGSGPGGGMWFAAKVDGQWELVWDGNGTIMCSDLEDYPNFPGQIIPECYSEEAGEVVIR